MDQNEFATELESLFSNHGVVVDEVKVFENSDEGLKAWVVLDEEDELKMSIGRELRNRGFSLVNHEGSHPFDDVEKDAYLVWSE